jgi:hypothetical protein
MMLMLMAMMMMLMLMRLRQHHRLLLLPLPCGGSHLHKRHQRVVFVGCPRTSHLVCQVELRVGAALGLHTSAYA